MTATSARSRGPPRRITPLHLGSVIAPPDIHQDVLAFPHPQVDYVEQTVGLQWLGPVGDVVLMAQFVGDVLERLVQVLHLEREEGAPTGFLRQVPEYLIAIAFN